jgi:hypothetical protein
MLLSAVLMLGIFSCSSEEEDSGREIKTDSIAIDKACMTIEQVNDVFIKYQSIEELKEHADEISQIKNVEDVYFTDITMYVRIKDFLTVSFCFYPEYTFDATRIESFFDIPVTTRQARTRANTDKSFSKLGYEKAVIIDQVYKDKDLSLYEDNLKELLDRVGIKTKINATPTLDYLKKELFDNDIVLFLCHGHYDNVTKLHWLDFCHLEKYDWSQYPSMSFGECLKNDFELVKGNSLHIKDDMLQITITAYWEYFRLVEYASYSISEKFISSINTDFTKKGKALVFNCACKSMMSGDNTKKDNNGRSDEFAKAFIKRGAGVYFGYDENNGNGPQAGLILLSGIASGQSVRNAYELISEEVIHEKKDNSNIDKGIPATRTWIADLLYYPQNHFEIENYCQVFPTLYEKKETDLSYTLKLTEPYNLMEVTKTDKVTKDGEEKMRVTEIKLCSVQFTYGFEVSTSKDFNSSNTLDYGFKYVEGNYSYFESLDNQILCLTYSIPKSDLAPQTTYYYRAYLNDGFDKYYSDYKEFTTPEMTIAQVIPEDIRKEIEPYIPLYEGKNPPNINGTYLIEPVELVYDSGDSYKPGFDKFFPFYIKFSNQNPNNNTIDCQQKEFYKGKRYGESEGKGVYISGEGNNFTVYFDSTGESFFDEYSVVTKKADIISGKKTDDGIKDIRHVLIMLEKGSDPKNKVMKVGKFRVFKDGDEMAKNATWPSSTREQQITVDDEEIITPWIHANSAK